MSDRAPHRTRAGLAGECLFAAGLGLLLLATGVWQRASAMGNLSGDWIGLANLMGLRMGGTPLGAEVTRFVMAQLALHLGFGLLAWLLAWLTRRVARKSPMRQLWLIAAWFAALTAWVLIANATLFPWSRSGIPSQLLGQEILGDARLFEICSLALLSAIVVLLLLNARAVPILHRSGKRIAIYGTLAILVGVVGAASWSARETTKNMQAGGPPNIFLIGIDSLRGDVVGGGESPGITPNVDVFVRDGGQLFTDAITPLARTFPSWTAILSGRTPRSTAARDNLIPFETLRPFDTIAKVAQRNGYRTIFATDEVRFSNIDASFGFDQVFTPTIGTADFLLGKFNDLPLSNLLANTWLGRQLFPATFANRAADVTYEPDTFVNWLTANIPAQAPTPTMMAVHFTLPHAPYNWAVSDKAVFGDTTDTAYQYSRAVIAADHQFGQLMAALERKGLLRNALVVVLSDHGEALGLPASDSLLRGAVARDMLDGLRISLWGHGTSVLSPHQYSAVLAMRGYGAVDLPAVFRAHEVPVSLIDVAPTVADLAGLETASGFDGTSLRAAISGDASAIEALDRRPRFTETGIRTKKLEQGDFDERSVLGDVATFFRMNPVNGRLELRPELMPELLADKERAALTRDWLLASVPSRGKQMQKYILVNRRDGTARRLEVTPASGDAQAYPLWQALHDQYGAEMLPPEPRTAQVASGAR